uniref:Uncharacterized protein n=1 Tax=Solanum tuberosum TaxID=4113 RepID=M1DPJ1_SOLTU
MSPNDFSDSPLVCLIAVSCLPSTPSRSGPLGGIVLLRGTIRRSADCSFHRLFDPSLSGLRVLEQMAETSVKNIKIFLDEETLGFILGVPARGIRSIEGCKPSMPLGRGVPGTTKQMFTAATLLECECVDEKTKGRSQVADVLEQQATLKRELTDLCDPK